MVVKQSTLLRMRTFSYASSMAAGTFQLMVRLLLARQFAAEECCSVRTGTEREREREGGRREREKNLVKKNVTMGYFYIFISCNVIPEYYRQHSTKVTKYKELSFRRDLSYWRDTDLFIKQS